MAFRVEKIAPGEGGDSKSARKKRVSATAGAIPKAKRREQQRAIDTRRVILDAALNEFAERGFNGASIRRIGERAGIEHTLIGYHYKTKDTLWRAVATDAFAQMNAKSEEAFRSNPTNSAAESVRLEFRNFLQFTIEHTDFHHFMLQENHEPSPRLKWLVENILSKSRERILPKIRQAQADGAMLQGNPDFVYYLMIGMVNVPSSLKYEMKATAGFSADDPGDLVEYWALVERALFC